MLDKKIKNKSFNYIIQMTHSEYRYSYRYVIGIVHVYVRGRNSRTAVERDHFIHWYLFQRFAFPF